MKHENLLEKSTNLKRKQYLLFSFTKLSSILCFLELPEWENFWHNWNKVIPYDMIFFTMIHPLQHYEFYLYFSYFQEEETQLSLFLVFMDWQCELCSHRTIATTMRKGSKQLSHYPIYTPTVMTHIKNDFISPEKEFLFTSYITRKRK